ncbi:hypothetical protein Bca52824_010268 [Brassica carinata]|uniref:Uncharacterized protein n=1 Tax=Brassica carinata TaxID=52824 RepID=A0A8X7WEQ8_BRACI|nr:hypothetical protein Bca52824_010268 [Brassica carinata]
MISMAQLKGVWVEAAEENHEDFNEGIIQVQAKKKASAKSLCNSIKIGKILTHRENNDGRQLIYEKLPKDIASLDHVLASGTSRDSCAPKKHPMRTQIKRRRSNTQHPFIKESNTSRTAKNEGRSGTLAVSQDKERIYGAKDMVKIYDDPCYNIQKK